MSWSDNKELLSGADAMLKFSIKKEKKRKEKENYDTRPKKKKNEKEKETSLHTQSACDESTIYIA